MRVVVVVVVWVHHIKRDIEDWQTVTHYSVHILGLSYEKSRGIIYK